MHRLVNGTLYNIIEVVTPNQIALVTTTAHSVQGYDSDAPVEIESIPEKNEPPGTQGELHYSNGTLVWVYVDVPLTVDDKVATLDERTVGMQAIDDFTLQAQATIDERTVGMQEIDDFTLLQVTDLQQQVDQLKADVAALKGGV